MKDSSCHACPEGASCPEGTKLGTLVIEPEYYRFTNTSTKIYPCPWGEESCPGKGSFGDDVCAKGYEGPLCSTCSERFYMVSGRSGTVPTRSEGPTHPLIPPSFVPLFPKDTHARVCRDCTATHVRPAFFVGVGLIVLAVFTWIVLGEWLEKQAHLMDMGKLRIVVFANLQVSQRGGGGCDRQSDMTTQPRHNPRSPDIRSSGRSRTC